MAVLATAGNKEHVRRPCVGLSAEAGGVVLDTEVVADGTFSCRAFEPQPTTCCKGSSLSTGLTQVPGRAL